MKTARTDTRENSINDAKDPFEEKRILFLSFFAEHETDTEQT